MVQALRTVLDVRRRTLAVPVCVVREWLFLYDRSPTPSTLLMVGTGFVLPESGWGPLCSAWALACIPVEDIKRGQWPMHWGLGS